MNRNEDSEKCHKEYLILPRQLFIVIFVIIKDGTICVSPEPE